MLAAGADPRAEQRSSLLPPRRPLPAEPPGPPQVRYLLPLPGLGCAQAAEGQQDPPGAAGLLAGHGSRGRGSGARGARRRRRAGAFCSLFPASAALASRPPRRRARLPGASGRRPRRVPAPGPPPPGPGAPLGSGPGSLSAAPRPLPAACTGGRGRPRTSARPRPQVRQGPAPVGSRSPLLASPRPRSFPSGGLLRHRLPPAAEPRQEENEEEEKEATCPGSSSSCSPCSQPSPR